MTVNQKTTFESNAVIHFRLSFLRCHERISKSNCIFTHMLKRESLNGNVEQAWKFTFISLHPSSVYCTHTHTHTRVIESPKSDCEQ